MERGYVVGLPSLEFRLLGRLFLSPEGRFENSPAVHCRVQYRYFISPEGTVESPLVFYGRSDSKDVVVQPSLRDESPFSFNPTLESVGYSRFSLRETAGEFFPLPAE